MSAAHLGAVQRAVCALHADKGAKVGELRDDALDHVTLLQRLHKVGHVRRPLAQDELPPWNVDLHRLMTLI